MSARVFAAVTRRGLADHRRVVLVWGASLGALGAFMAAIYPSIQDSLAKVAQSYPEGLREAFGVEGLGTVEAYVHAELFSLIVPLALGFVAVRAVAGPTATAEERGYLDTVLTLPLARWVLMASAFAVACAVSAGVLLLMGATTFTAGRIAGTGISLTRTAAGVAGAWSLAVFAAGVAAVGCGALHRGRAVMGLGLGTLVAMYVLDVAGRLSATLEPLRWASAFRYSGAPLRDGLDAAGFALLVVAGLALAALGAALFERREILR